ncbi:MAG TPA: YfiR family protein [Verrucomicrobiae bacterium]|nr:YfiR family protein [Verrucomicrobiae bacterium]
MRGGVAARESQPSEYAVKAAFLFNFIKFVEWPEKSLPEKTSTILIGVYGHNSFYKDLEQTIQNKKIDEHPVSLQEVDTPADAAKCQLVFIGATEKSHVAEVIGALKGKSILTVGETDGFIEAGGMINFVREGPKIRFQINNDAATAAGLQISAKLLMLAVAKR